jgi:hypothetical protein
MKQLLKNAEYKNVKIISNKKIVSKNYKYLNRFQSIQQQDLFVQSRK